MFNWDNKTLKEILDLYDGNLFMAEFDYQEMGLTHADWAMLIAEGMRQKVIGTTVGMVMIERASVK